MIDQIKTLKESISKKMSSSTLLEVTRATHEDTEQLERLIVKVLKNEEPTFNKKQRLSQMHHVRYTIDQIIYATHKLVDIYKDKGNARKEEIGYPIPTGPTGNDSGPFSAGEYSNGQNHMESMGTKGLFTTRERLRAAMMCLEGSALSWSRWSANKEPFRTWEELKSQMLIRFQSSQAGNLHGQFFSITQNGTARDYVMTFEKMAAQLTGLQEEVQEGIFIKGLKPDLRVAVCTQKPVGVRQAMELALLVDEGGKGVAANPPNEVGGGVPRTSTGAPGAKTRKTPFKRMIEAEMANKRAKGLCYRCDRMFGSGHRCPEKALQVLWVGEDEDEEEEEILEYHRRFPSTRNETHDEYEHLLKEVQFSGEEADGFYLDMHALHHEYLNSKLGKKVEEVGIDMDCYTSVAELVELAPEKLKEALRVLGLKTGGTVQQRAKRLFVMKHTPLENLDKKHFVTEGDSKENALVEAKIMKLYEILSETIMQTKDNVKKKQGLTYHEMVVEREDDDDVVEVGNDGESLSKYNPLNLPMGWDGKPRPYWLSKLHGLEKGVQVRDMWKQ
nr:splicing factor SF3a60 homolog [Tanacetum cinerariifolium]